MGIPCGDRAGYPAGKAVEALAGLAAGSTQEEYKLKTTRRIGIGAVVRETEQRVAAIPDDMPNRVDPEDPTFHRVFRNDS
jgi:hypothetical protein